MTGQTHTGAFSRQSFADLLKQLLRAWGRRPLGRGKDPQQDTEEGQPIGIGLAGGSGITVELDHEVAD